jgi:hypothetical protein
MKNVQRKINSGSEDIGQLVNKQRRHRNYKRGSCMGVYVYNNSHNKCDDTTIRASALPATVMLSPQMSVYA